MSTPEPVAQPIVGYRAWQIVKGGTLRSMCHGFTANSTAWDTVWETAEKTATCWTKGSRIFEPCEAPDLAHTCGLYAIHDQPPEPKDCPLRTDTWIHGAVVAWGRIITGPNGFRAQHMRIVGLFDEAPSCYRLGARARAQLDVPGMLAAAGERYGVPVLSRPELAAYASWFGASAKDNEERAEEAME